VRGWAPRPYYGKIAGGIALGTVIAATAVGDGEHVLQLDPAQQTYDRWIHCGGTAVGLRRSSCEGLDASNLNLLGGAYSTFNS
jgi:hypothetical protein